MSPPTLLVDQASTWISCFPNFGMQRFLSDPLSNACLAQSLASTATISWRSRRCRPCYCSLVTCRLQLQLHRWEGTLVLDHDRIFGLIHWLGQHNSITFARSQMQHNVA